MGISATKSKSCQPFTSVRCTCWKNRAVPKAGGPSRAGAISQKNGCRSTSPRRQCLPSMPAAWLSSAWLCGVRSSRRSRRSSGTPRSAITAAITQSDRQGSEDMSATKMTGSTACPSVTPRPATDNARPRAATNHRDIDTMAMRPIIPCPKNRSPRIASGSSQTDALSAMPRQASARQTRPAPPSTRERKRSVSPPALTISIADSVVPMA